MRLIVISILALIANSNIYAQGCCSGGAGSPIAGGAASGVLQENQMEISINHQFNTSSVFYTGSEKTEPLFDNLSSNYIFFRTDYGVSKKLTLSLASGYYLDKTKETKHLENIRTSSGYSDLMMFPRYSIYNKSANFKRTEIALGLGVKMPLGTHMDSTLYYSDEWIGDQYSINAPLVQTTNGSNDFMFYSFIFREYQKRKLRLFISALHVKKSFNSLGIKFGNYSSLGLFASKTFFRKWGLTSQLKLEHVGKVQAAGNIDLLGNYSIDPISTGSNKAFFIPQISYSQNGLTFFATSEIPVYQYLHGTQVGSQNQFTIGINYRFLTKECSPEFELGK
ncbi:MAG: hypothetical protein HOM24_04620 [Flavobacteriales bacterium]|jgi:hypothetical protein|nr:hypothetical protein [Flavobacteriales bacterium]MBT5750770.1 hypothetical protein [Flavobacteriales bacterium]